MKWPLATVLLLLGVMSARATDAVTPATLARTLVMAQDQTVHGSTAALESIVELRRWLAAEIERTPASTWKDPQQGRALVVHLLNDGDTRHIRTLIDEKIDLGEWRAVLSSLLAFSERQKGAVEQLGRIDARRLDPGLAGEFALIQAIANASKPEVAQKYLAEAKLLSPGGFVEDAAIRREFRLHLDAGRKIQAARTAAHYLWRFGASIYANDVVQFLATSFMPGLGGHAESKEAITSLIAELPPAARVEVLLTLGRSALLQGKAEVADIAASATLSVTAPGSAERSRAALYAAIAQALIDPSKVSTDKLRESESNAVSDEDIALLRASKLIFDRIRSPVKADAAVDVTTTPAVDAAAKAVRSAQAILDRDRP